MKLINSVNSHSAAAGRHRERAGFHSSSALCVSTCLLAFFLLATTLSPTLAFQINLKGYPEIEQIFRIASDYGFKISLFGGTGRDVILENPISMHDQFDILLPPEFIEGELTLDQREFIRKMETIAGGAKRLHLIYAKGRETFNKLYVVGGLSINKVVITSDGKVIDRHGGLNDAQRRLLRHIPGVDSYWPSFLPLFDVLRGIRFLTQYSDFSLDPATASYYRGAVRKVSEDSDLIHRVLTIFKNVSENQPHARDFPGDSKVFITTKVQIRELKNRLDKIFLFAQNPSRAEKLLSDFGVTDFLKKIRWPEKDYTIAKMDIARLRSRYGISKTPQLQMASVPAARPVASRTAQPATPTYTRPAPRPDTANAMAALGMNYQTQEDSGSSAANQDYQDYQDSGDTQDYSSQAQDSGQTDDSAWMGEEPEQQQAGKSEEGYSAPMVEGEYSEAAQEAGQAEEFKDPFEDINFEDFNLDDF